jgi:UPF0755 protein
MQYTPLPGDHPRNGERTSGRRLDRTVRRRRARRDAVIAGAGVLIAAALVTGGLLLYHSLTGQRAKPATVYRVVIPEGLTVKQTAARVQEATRGHISSSQYMDVASSGPFRQAFLKDADGNLEGFLFPKTYEVTGLTSARSMVNKQLKQFGIETSDLDWGRAASLGVTPYKVVIIASMIEKEVKLPSERPLVASVIYNRLKKGMKLGIDATIQYALGEWKPRLTDSDLKVDSPYNTYTHSGLPPAPICNPGFESIRAALYPASTDYIYYILTSPAEGRHSFTSDYQQFARWKKEQNGGL